MRKKTIALIVLAIAAIALLIWVRPSIAWAYTNIR